MTIAFEHPEYDGEPPASWDKAVQRENATAFARDAPEGAVTRRCQSKSQYGDCGRPAKHDGDHAVPIGDRLVFGYRRGGAMIGYGYLVADEVDPSALTEALTPPEEQ